MPKRKKTPPKKREFDNRPLSGLAALKKNLKGQSETPAPIEDPPEITPPENDEDLFFQSMAQVAPLSGRNSSLPKEPRIASMKAADEQENDEVMQALYDLVGGESPLEIHETDEAIEGAVEGLDPQILNRLRNGEFSIQDHLDLHGFDREEARDKVGLFIDNSILHGKRCVLIIHGRGHGSTDHIPVLKTALRNWFNRRGFKKKILAFTSARPCDGGAGAVYVLLRKPSRVLR